MFAPNCVGTANATAAGWGNLGGGVAQIVMPLLLGALLATGIDAHTGWRLAMVVPGIALAATAVAYWFLTQDLPDGDYQEHRRALGMKKSMGGIRALLDTAKDRRVWALFGIYGACFGVELTIHNIAAIYYFDHFNLDLKTAGLLAGTFGLSNIFARTLGGLLSDRVGKVWGLNGRVTLVGFLLTAEGVALAVFSQIHVLVPAVIMMAVFAVMVHMANGATFGVVPFVNPSALGAVSGIVGAGGNAGAVAAGFLFRSQAVSMADGFLYLGLAVVACSLLSLLVHYRVVPESDSPTLVPATTAQRGT